MTSTWEHYCGMMAVISAATWNGDLTLRMKRATDRTVSLALSRAHAQL